ncbi:MAG: hypothetical protein WCB99_06540 [Candidatus Cybelea sp.]
MMRISSFCARALSISVAAMLAGCGGSPPPIGAPGTMAQSHASSAAYAVHTKSWMAREAKSRALLYVSSDSGEVLVFAYPGGKPVGMLTGFKDPEGLCSDNKGDVFVVDSPAAQIVEYAHGGQSPIATLSDSGNHPNGCFIDPESGDLAVAGGSPIYTTGNIAIYKNAQGPPTVYQSTAVALNYCTYDGNGNVFAKGKSNGFDGVIAELPRGSSQLSFVSLDKSLGQGGAIQWDGRYLAVGNPRDSAHPYGGPNAIYQVEVSGSSATVVNTIELSDGKGAKRNKNPGGAQFWIQERTIIAPKGPAGGIGLWKYPKGGKVSETISESGTFVGVTVSLASSDVRE